MTRYEDAGDVDLDTEVVRRRDGTRITEADAEEQGRRIAERGPGGRPSLSGGKHSPQIGVRLPEDLNERLRDRAEQEHKRPSEIVREALEEYV